MNEARPVMRIVLAVVLRPHLWGSALGVVRRHIPEAWWRHGPMPPRDYLRYRGNAVYGMPLHRIPPEDFVRYLEWCKAFPGPIT